MHIQSTGNVADIWLARRNMAVDKAPKPKPTKQQAPSVETNTASENAVVVKPTLASPKPGKIVDKNIGPTTDMWGPAAEKYVPASDNAIPSNADPVQSQKPIQADSTDQAHLELKQATTQVEAIFVKDLIQKMRAGIPKSGATGPMADLAGDLFAQAVADQVSKNGSLGLGRLLFENLSKSLDAQKAAQVKIAGSDVVE